MSALPPKADISSVPWNVRFVPPPYFAAALPLPAAKGRAQAGCTPGAVTVTAGLYGNGTA